MEQGRMVGMSRTREAVKAYSEHRYQRGADKRTATPIIRDTARPTS
jgi:hypothetical protein